MSPLAARVATTLHAQHAAAGTVPPDAQALALRVAARLHELHAATRPPASPTRSAGDR